MAHKQKKKVRRLTKHGILDDVESNHSSRCEFRLARITVEECDTLVSGGWLVNHIGSKWTEGLFYCVSSLLTIVRAKVLLPDFLDPLTKYTPRVLFVLFWSSADMDERAFSHDGGRVKAWVSLVWCIIYTPTTHKI